MWTLMKMTQIVFDVILFKNILKEKLKENPEASIPRSGEGSFPLVGKDHCKSAQSCFCPDGLFRY